jgi:hypothetical protein
VPASQLWNLEWLSQNGQRKFPLADDASGQDVSGTGLRLPDDFLVDALIPVHADPTVDPAKFHILSVGVFGTGVTIVLGYDGAAVGQGSLDTTAFVRNTLLVIECVTPFADTVARLVVGGLTGVRKFSGLFNFTLAAARLSPRVVVPDIRGVSALYLRNGAELTGPITGDVVFEAGANALLSLVPGAGTPADPSRIIFNAVQGAGLNIPCECGEDPARPCIKTVNAIGPAANGNFDLADDECVKLQAIANGLKVVETCAKPCCDCADLATVKQEAERIAVQINGLENLSHRLETAVTALESNLLFSLANG